MNAESWLHSIKSNLLKITSLNGLIINMTVIYAAKVFQYILGPLERKA